MLNKYSLKKENRGKLLLISESFINYMEQENHYYLLLILFILSILLIFVNPEELLLPKVQFDELIKVNSFLNNDSGLLMNIFYYDSLSGRLDIALNLVPALLSSPKLKHLVYLPFFSAWLSFCFYIITFWFFLTRPFIVNYSKTQRILICLSIIFFFRHWDPFESLSMVFIPPVLGALSITILLTETKKITWGAHFLNNLILGFSGFSGGYTNLLTPSFILKAFYSKARRDKIYALTISVTSLIQLITFLFAADKDFILHRRGFTWPEDEIIIENFFNVFLHPFIGFLKIIENTCESLYYKANNLNLGFYKQHFSFPIIGLIIILLLIFMYKKNLSYHLIISIFVPSLIGFFLFSTDGVIRGRYSSIPILSLILYITNHISSQRDIIKFIQNTQKPLKYLFARTQHYLGWLMLICALLTGGINYFNYPSSFWYPIHNRTPHWIEEIKNFYFYPDYAFSPLFINVVPSPIKLTQDGTLEPYLFPDKIYKIKHVIFWTDYYQLYQRPILGNEKQFIDLSPIRFNLNIEQKGTYRINGCFCSRHISTTWLVSIHKKKSETILKYTPWVIWESYDWTWQSFQDELELDQGEYVVTMIPLERSPLSEILITQIE